MGLFLKEKRSEDIAQRIRNNECAQLLADKICKELNNDPGLQYIKTYGPKDRYRYYLTVKTAEVTIIKVNPHGKDYFDFKWSYHLKDFGYAPLPNKIYQTELFYYLKEQILIRCPGLEFKDPGYEKGKGQQIYGKEIELKQW
ncbi:MAG: hypothetical protein LUG46_05135 [Erysipelotrichaceae bacterium]|nr:hypothetical protein [Erysipelotrichaceae bacterium]